ncbi:YlmC/YmxH family sporulation protein [Clostridium brassicae]|uniref:YlmC/YmxH family sporulation protein n=1 Tax=Clostridium brassicae TaxID=2999072 RepID=A0ABT4DAU1_9CLOT|nr:YlmC/YmxH family sporulation protein [Clostridium brassicae]MCY6958246.1 YlmC/YmxH family sporulation protein [Clostridium brassicae]
MNLEFNNSKFYSELENYEIININNGERYNYLSNNDIIIDENGEMKFLIINNGKSHFNFFSNSEILEIPWEYVNKIGARTIIVDVEESELKRINK